MHGSEVYVQIDGDKVTRAVLAPNLLYSLVAIQVSTSQL